MSVRLGLGVVGSRAEKLLTGRSADDRGGAGGGDEGSWACPPLPGLCDAGSPRTRGVLPACDTADVGSESRGVRGAASKQWWIIDTS